LGLAVVAPIDIAELWLPCHSCQLTPPKIRQKRLEARAAVHHGWISH
jgi:hypothetical protein